MMVYFNLEAIPEQIETVIAVGKFDGVHRGHQRIIRAVVQRAKELGVTPAVVTFDRSPASLLKINSGDRLITTLPEKINQLQSLGVEATIVLQFLPEIAAMTPREFIQRILVGRLHIREIHEGSDFRFGANASGDSRQLIEMGGECGFGVQIHDPVLVDGGVVSSTRIRNLLREGNFRIAARLLHDDTNWSPSKVNVGKIGAYQDIASFTSTGGQRDNRY